MKTGRRNLITDVAGLRVGNADDCRLRSGVTVLVCNEPTVAAVDIRGGGPGTRETDLLGLSRTLDRIDALVLSGGSALGLGAATGVQSLLRERGVGFEIAGTRVPIVPQAVLFDLANGGEKDWGASPPYERLARLAADAAGDDFALGSTGAGYGATTAFLRGGLGSASVVLDDGIAIGALAAVNPAGCVTVAGTPHFWAAPFERQEEFGGRGLPDHYPAQSLLPTLKGSAGASTTLAIVATSARLTKPQARRFAVMAQAGLVRAVHPAHTPLDGDIVFALATGRHVLADEVADLARVGAMAAQTLARAIARGVYEAGGEGDDWQIPPSYRRRFG